MCTQQDSRVPILLSGVGAEKGWRRGFSIGGKVGKAYILILTYVYMYMLVMISCSTSVITLVQN